jgi:hypothetical protein
MLQSVASCPYDKITQTKIMNCSEVDQAAEATNVSGMLAEFDEGQDYLETLIEEVVAIIKEDKRFWKIRAMLSELRKAFDSIKKLNSECLEEQLHFEKKLICYLREATIESTMIDAVCTWIEVSEMLFKSVPY